MVRSTNVAAKILGNLLSPDEGRATEGARPSAVGDAYQYDWGSGKLETVVLKPQVIPIVAAPAVPPYVHEFARRAAKIVGVRGIVAETGEDQMSVHITTFATGLTDEIRAQIYQIESALILENPNVPFDFHLRRDEEASGTPTPVAGKYYYAIWGFRDANEGRTPSSGD